MAEKNARSRTLDAAQELCQAVGALDAFFGVLGQPSDDPLENVRPSALYYLLEPILVRVQTAHDLIYPLRD